MLRRVDRLNENYVFTNLYSFNIIILINEKSILTIGADKRVDGL